MKIGACMFAATFAAACGVDQPAGWSVDETTSDGAILGVWGTGPHDVWAVGGQANRSLVLHGDGESWRPVEVSTGAMLISTYGFTSSDVYAVGEHGLIIHWDGASWTQVASGTNQTLFGLWGASGDDVWIVGGDLAGAPGSAVVLRGSRGVFGPVAMPSELTPSVLFKAHGYGPDDVMMVGAGGTVLHWNGTTWSRDPMPTDQPLLSTWGSGSEDVYAVGGSSSAVILHSDGEQWSELANLPIGEGLSGVFTSSTGPTVAVGPHDLFEIDGAGSLTEPALPALATGTALHGVWGDSHGTTYAVGGTLDAYPRAMTGTILRK